MQLLISGNTLKCFNKCADYSLTSLLVCVLAEFKIVYFPPLFDFFSCILLEP